MNANAPETRTAPAGDTSLPGRRFPIVGIGASAGGLEALELFLRNVPQASGMAFVIVQHLDPTRKAIVAELLQRATPMKVVQVKDNMHVVPDCVYVIPPNKDLSLLRATLHLLDPVAPRGLRLPIDSFFRSLADDAEERSIGVVLSGMGSDGTMGVRAIKGRAGAVFVQDPLSAKFDGMPRSVIDAGLADVVAKAEALPSQIVDYVRRVPSSAKPGLAELDKANSALAKIVILLRARNGHDFSLYKKSTLYRRIERRMGIQQVDQIATYVRLLQENPRELDLLFGELLIGVTSFFRDLTAWDALANEFLPLLLRDHPPGRALRAWVPACATGEEAYSLAMALREAQERLDPPQHHVLQVFATDLSRDAIDKARQGVFPVSIAADVSPERLSRFFVREHEGYRVAKSIREMVIFAPQNLIMDPPFTKLDFLSCRNLLIYLTAELQQGLMPVFHYSLNPGGMLFLGSAETIAGSSELFAPLSERARLYRRRDAVARVGLELPTALIPTGPIVLERSKSLPTAGNIQSQAEALLLQRYVPPAVLVNAKGDILYISGRTGKYLEPAAGKTNWNVFAMARPGLSPELGSAFRRAQRQSGAVTSRGLKVGTNGGVQAVDLTVQAIVEPDPLAGLMLVVFQDVATAVASRSPGPAKRGAARSAGLGEMERVLEDTRQELQTTREEMRTSQEELQSINEELQSTNEELQSTNEELTTSKEEMQSMNEELRTVNQELQAKLEDLSRASNDMKNLLDNTEIVTLFLDRVLRVRLFTAGADKILRLIPSDIGRPITDIASDVVYGELAHDAAEVLRKLAPREKQVTTLDGRWFSVRIMPYRTLENMIDGTVITFMDITASKKLEAQLRKTQAALEARIVEQAGSVED